MNLSTIIEIVFILSSSVLILGAIILFFTKYRHLELAARIESSLFWPLALFVEYYIEPIIKKNEEENNPK